MNYILRIFTECFLEFFQSPEESADPEFPDGWIVLEPGWLFGSEVEHDIAVVDEYWILVVGPDRTQGIVQGAVFDMSKTAGPSISVISCTRKER